LNVKLRRGKKNSLARAGEAVASEQESIINSQGNIPGNVKWEHGRRGQCSTKEKGYWVFSFGKSQRRARHKQARPVAKAF